MSYLYGDSTPSDLEGNYIEFLRDAVEFCVQVLLSDQRIVQAKGQTRALEHATVAEVERLQKLGPLVTKAFEGASLGAPESPTARCAAAITSAANELMRAEAIRMRDALDAEIVKREASATQERESCVKALETLIVKHDLPGAASDIQLVLVAGGRYAGRARMKTGFGLEALVDLEVPNGNLFDRVVRVDRLMERLDVQAPEVGGWLHKEVKRRPQHLEKLHITEFSGGAEGGVVKLRLGPDGTGVGFDVLYSDEAPRVRMLRVTEQTNGAGEQPFDVDDEDARKLLALHGKLAKAAAELAGHRRRLVDAKVDGEAMRTHAKPTLLPERLIAKMAPVVQEIAARSHSPGELILRRLLAGDRREEIFLSKAELKQKVEPLSDANRSLFDPLWLITMPGAAAKAEPAEAVPAPGSAPHRQTGKYRPVTPARGSVSASTSSSAPTAVAAQPAPPPAPSPAAGPAAKPALDTPAGDAMRRTMIGTTGPAASPSLVPPADSVSKTPIAAATHVEALRKEAAGTIEAAIVKQADPTTRS
jgi:hypothetical protein